MAASQSHFTHLWAKKAIELGDPSHIQEIRDNKKLLAEGIDRYLVNSNQKQLCGTQFSKPSLDPKDCWCIEEVEKSFLLNWHFFHPPSPHQTFAGFQMARQVPMD